MTSKPGSTSGGRSMARRYAALPTSAVVTERVGVPRTEIFPSIELQILLGCLQHVCRYLRDSIAEDEGGLAYGCAANRGRSARSRSVTRVRASVGVTRYDRDLVRVQSDGLCAQLRQDHS